MALFGIEKKRIITLSIVGDRTALARAVWDGERLIVTGIEALRFSSEWLATVNQELEKAFHNGWVSLVEDKTMSFPSEATPFNFDAIDSETRKTNMQVALDHYFALQSRGSLILGENVARFALKSGEGGIIDFDTNEKGQQVYKVDWSKIRSEHKAMLLCVVAATFEEPRSEHWVQSYLKAMDTLKQEHSPLDTFEKITAGYNETLQKEYYLKVEETEAKKHG